MALTVLAAYDIPVDRRRARLAALLQSWGDRIQLSVFLCTIEDDQLGVLRDTIAAIIDPDEDSVFLVRQCKDCWSGVINLGQSEPPRDDPFWGVF
ncbi:CRISPR-associated endonuclease Cas2 [Skermania piniformis]|uniref:CRISPR-associated endoribonuclease Cas2 n=1 Tax=Skermania pinensis TaxID=39122 RepID=A0ABX8S9F8_9ACTN|nr:CRISPR-associated endonuclease Cas2 [Skermania piniformis]QXQ14500.1 CRISPR-associated endonuclease Cas2 [Skermania piniformis]